jgi:hypothetical protein
MPRDVPSRQDLLALVPRIHPGYSPVWDGLPTVEQGSLAAFFLPHRPKRYPLKPTRPKVVKWYCPFASQTQFPSGHRYCINVYVGCAHRCSYCYVSRYQKEKLARKRDFESLINRDVADLERFDVPSAPVHHDAQEEWRSRPSEMLRSPARATAGGRRSPAVPATPVAACRVSHNSQPIWRYAMSIFTVSIQELRDAIWAALEIGPPRVFKSELKLVRRKRPTGQVDILVDCRGLAGRLGVSHYASTEMVARAASMIAGVAAARVSGPFVALDIPALQLPLRSAATACGISGMEEDQHIVMERFWQHGDASRACPEDCPARG